MILGLYQSGSFHRVSQTKTGTPPDVQMLCWLLPSPQKQNRKEIIMKGDGFFGAAWGN